MEEDGQMKRIAILTTDIPSSTGSGYKIRCFYIAKALARNFSVEIFSLAEEDDSKNKELDFANNLDVTYYSPKEKNKITWFLKRILRLLFSVRPAGVLRIRNKQFAEKITKEQKKKRYDYVITEGIWTAQYLDLFDGTKKIIDNHNVETLLYKRELGLLSFIKKMVKWIDWKKLGKYESDKNKEADLSIVVSREDAGVLEEMGVEEDKIKVISNVVEIPLVGEKPKSPINGEYIIFAGLLSYFPNEDGILWFGEKVWPIIKNKFPRLQFVIVGKNPSDKIKKIFENDKNILITGFVRDIFPYRKNALMEIVPLRMGGGTRFKILEAFSLNIPVVSTTVGAEGLGATEEQILIGDSPEEFANQIVKLLEDKETKERLVISARKLLEEKYSLSKVSEDIIKTISRL